MKRSKRPCPAARKRARIMARLYENFHGRCFWCSTPLKIAQATRDHVIPKSKGGGDGIKNLLLSCQPCNVARGDIDADEWLAIVTAERIARAA